MQSEVEVTLEVGTIGNFKWTDANTADLIVWRVSNSSLFTGKRNTAMRAFEQFVKEKALEGKVTPAWVKKKWENLRQKYKDIKNLSMVGGEPCAAPWKWYAVMDQALSGEITCTSMTTFPTILCPSPHTSSPFTSTVLVSSSAQDPPPVKRKKDQYLQAALQELEKRQEERERQALEREEERERQALERECRREQELLVRQERWEREYREREERREREYREREERREREASAREDRLFKLLETFVSKQ
ncbi:UBX domain-containing protein 1 isoform X1 [Electrophorus electricus]|uniref:UBX domain-containing protein 1 isoform X1 n=2 Tax=Electrophorus electricus TaxID=8005 RepID=UPI0015CFCF7D|nr:UBX domain-containing protein 1 isoform X1 [Electrophorus electricus]